jgi:hypothetical protein
MQITAVETFLVAPLGAVLAVAVVTDRLRARPGERKRR